MLDYYFLTSGIVVIKSSLNLAPNGTILHIMGISLINNVLMEQNRFVVNMLVCTCECGTFFFSQQTF